MDPKLTPLEPGELESVIESMQPWPIDDVGNRSWIEWHIKLQKLNQQAVVEATTMQEEAAKQTLISKGKLKVVVYEAICIQVWRLKIYPQIIKLEPTPANTFRFYMVLFHEAAAVGLLETILFHEDGIQCISDVLIDLLEYGIEQMLALVVLINNGYLKPKSERDLQTETVPEEMERQKQTIQFGISMKCIPIVRYIAEHMDTTGMAAAITTSFYKKHDVPSLLAQLLNLEPWKRLDNKGRLEVFHYGTWRKPVNPAQVHRSQAQLWLCLRQLLIEPRLLHLYAIEDSRRDLLCQLQTKMADELLDQIPPMVNLKTFLCQLSVGHYCGPPNSASARTPYCAYIEVVPQVKESYLKKVHKRTKTLAKAHLVSCYQDRSTVHRVMETYASDAVMAMESGRPRCSKCGFPASKKCSRCKLDWYCGRECQILLWPSHKRLCDQMIELNG